MTKTLHYPTGDAENIAKARLRGLKPAGTVLIVLCDRQDCSNPQVFPEIGTAYRWDFLKGLCVVVMKNQIHDVAGLLQDIERTEPAQIDLIDIDTGEGWMVLFANPLKTLRLPAHQVADWLGAGQWHRDLQSIKDRARLTAAAGKQKPKYEPEAVWS
jgi:hypothetical protein